MSFGETVTFTPGRTYDSNDNAVTAVGDPNPVAGCVIEPLGSEELTIRGRTGLHTKIRVYISEVPATPILDTDDVSIRGVTYMVGGIGDQWIDPEASTDIGGLVVDAYRAEG